MTDLSSASHYQLTELGDAIDLLRLHALSPERYPHLLCSASDGLQDGGNSRYDILFAFPEETLCLTAEELMSDLPLLEEAAGDLFGMQDFLPVFDQWFQREKLLVPSAEDIPFTGGWFTYLAYELAGQIEPSLQLPLPKQQPIAFATRFRCALLVEKHSQKLLLVQESDQDHDSLLARERQVHEDIAAATEVHLAAGKVPVSQLDEQDPEIYLDWVDKVQDYIREGDVFQVNLSRPWRAQLSEPLSSAVIFASLRKQNPSPFSALVHFPGMDVISSSPERLISVRDGLAETRPIAGTRPRLDAGEDDFTTRELLGNPKERSEHIMLIDLERNDLGRVCQPGTVEVNELMALESYAHVHHIVSNVRGQLRPEILPGQAIAAVFPGGTITGCPKVRCMEILAELEREPRGAYTGSLGYINRNGDMDLNILIRTMVRQGDELTLRAGGGIVADSQAKKELEETRAKAKGMLKVFNAVTE